MANKSLGFIRRNIRCCKPNSKDESYKTIIRPWPSSEYEFNSVGPIHQTTHKLIGSMEMVQRMAARFVFNSWNHHYHLVTTRCM